MFLSSIWIKIPAEIYTLTCPPAGSLRPIQQLSHNPALIIRSSRRLNALVYWNTCQRIIIWIYLALCLFLAKQLTLTSSSRWALSLFEILSKCMLTLKKMFYPFHGQTKPSVDPLWTIFNALSEVLFLSQEQLDSTVAIASESLPTWWDLAVGWEFAAQPAEPRPTPERRNTPGCFLNITWGQVMKATVTGESGDAPWPHRRYALKAAGRSDFKAALKFCTSVYKLAAKLLQTGLRSATGQTKVSLCWDVLTQLSATFVVTIHPTAAQTAGIGLHCDGGSVKEIWLNGWSWAGAWERGKLEERFLWFYLKEASVG